MALSFYHAAVQALCLLICAPLIAGIVNKTKAFLQKRQGASIFQEYFDLWKWWRKPVIVTKYTSWVFLAAPIIYLVTSIMAAMMLPGLLQGNIRFGDAFVFVYVLALGRFFMTLGSLDSATAFGGMGGSREIYISVLVEPAVMLAVLLNASRYGSTMLSQMVIDYNAFYFTVPAVLGSVAFFLVMLAENSRLPVDNPDTHLELTMIHECMTLEYSGRLLSYLLCAVRCALPALAATDGGQGADDGVVGWSCGNPEQQDASVQSSCVSGGSGYHAGCSDYCPVS